MAKVFERLGIAEAVQAKAKYGAGGAGGLAGLVLLRGEADIGIQQMAELMAVDAIDVVGPLPPEIQMVTPFVAAIPTNASHAAAGRAVIAFLTTPDAKRVLKGKGLDPASPPKQPAYGRRSRRSPPSEFSKQRTNATLVHANAGARSAIQQPLQVKG